MSHFPKPFYRESRGLWYVQINGKQINLGPAKDDAYTRYHELMAKPKDAPLVPTPTRGPLVVVLIDEFLEWCKKHRSPDTYRWYKDRLNAFCRSIPVDLSVDDFKPFHVQKWVDAQSDLASGSRRNLIAAVKRAMRWAEEQGYVDRSPVAHMKKPGCGRKEQVVSPEEFQKILGGVKDEAFRDLLNVTWETGARPQETLRVEARHVDFPNARWVFPASEAKGGKVPRIVYLTPSALEITTRLAERRPTGPLFCNTDGFPWTPDATNCRFQTIKRKLGIKYSLYSFRHTWINRMLMGGVDALTVAVLAGHSDPSMLANHYAHLSQSPAFLGEQARRALK